MKTLRTALTIGLLLLFVQFSFGQNQKTICFRYDTIPHSGLKTLTTHTDSAFIIGDGGFYNDSVVIQLDGKVYKGLFNTDMGIGFAGKKKIPKPKSDKVTLIIDRKNKFTFNYDKRYSLVHLVLANNQVIWTYTNNIYRYE